MDDGGDGPVPVLLTGRNPDHVSGADLVDGVTPPLDAADARRDDQDLAARMRVPRRAGAGLERDGAATGVRGVARLEQHLDANVAREVLRWCRAGRRESRRG